MRRQLQHLVRSLGHRPAVRECVICGHTSVFINTGGPPFISVRCLRCRSTAIHRALYRTLQARFGADLARLRGCDVYEASAHGAFHDSLRRRSEQVGFRLWSSEFYDGWVPGEYYNGVRCEDLQQLTFGDGMFDLVTSSEVMEHVEDLERAMAEVRRVLKPGGWYIFSVPIDMDRPETLVRATRDARGERVDLHPPEYHGDPVRGERGVFTWRTFGADLPERMAAMGFEAALEPAELPELAAAVTARRPIAVLRKPVDRALAATM